MHANQPANNQSNRAEHQKSLLRSQPTAISRGGRRLSSVTEEPGTLLSPCAYSRSLHQSTHAQSTTQESVSSYVGKTQSDTGMFSERCKIFKVVTCNSNSQSWGPLMPILFQTKGRTWDERGEVCASSTIRSKMLIIPIVLFLSLLLTMYNQSRNKVISMTSPFLDALMKIILPQDFEIPKFIQEASATFGKQS